MSAATWRQFFSYNKYTQIAARAVRQSLKENERLVAEKRGLTALRYQHWEGGKGGEQNRNVVAFEDSGVIAQSVYLLYAYRSGKIEEMKQEGLKAPAPVISVYIDYLGTDFLAQ